MGYCQQIGMPCLFVKPVQGPAGKNPWTTIEKCAFLRDLIGDKPVAVPTDLQNIRDPRELSGENLEIIATAIAQISYHQYYRIPWPYLYDCAHPMDDEKFASHREIFFETFTKLVLSLYDMEDFQRYIDMQHIVDSSVLFLDYLQQQYGNTPASARRALLDISSGKLLLNEFPFLWEQDVDFNLAYYYLMCCEPERHRYHEYPWQIGSWPFINFLLIETNIIGQHHVQSVMKVLKEYVPLKENEKRVLLHNMLSGRGDITTALSLECLKEIQFRDFEKLNTHDRDIDFSASDFVRSPFSYGVPEFIENKKYGVRVSSTNVTFPLKSGVFGNFTAEVLEVIQVANVERRIAGKRFLSPSLIQTAILRSQIGDKARALLLSKYKWEQTGYPLCSREEYIEESNRPVYYIYDLAYYIVFILASLGWNYCPVKLEHMFLATVCASWRREDLKGFLSSDTVAEFLIACGNDNCQSELSAPSSPDKKKMKYSKDYMQNMEDSLLPDEIGNRRDVFSEDEKIWNRGADIEVEWVGFMDDPPILSEEEEYMLYTKPIYWTPEFMKFINDAFKCGRLDDLRQKIFYEDFTWEKFISSIM